MRRKKKAVAAVHPTTPHEGRMGRPTFPVLKKLGDSILGSLGLTGDAHYDSYEIDRESGILYGVSSSELAKFEIATLPKKEVQRAESIMGRNPHIKVQDVYTAPVVNPVTGEQVDTRTFVNLPIRALFPDAHFMVCDWKLTLGRGEMHPELDPIGEGTVYAGGDPEFEERYGREPHYHDYVWNPAAAKNFVTFAFKEDVLAKMRMYVRVADVNRSGVHLMQEGHYGYVHSKVLRIMVLPAGKRTLPSGEVVHVSDGGGIMSARFADELYNGGKKWKLQNPLNPHMELTHFLPSEHWEAVFEEVKPLCDAEFDKNFGGAYHMQMRAFSPEELALADKVPSILRHPYFANRLASGHQQELRRACTCAPYPGSYRVAIPNWDIKKVAVDEKSIIGRWPQDSLTMRDVVDPADDPRSAEIKAWADEKEGCQYRISSHDFHAKGIAVVVPEIGNGYDMVLCDKDVKMAGPIYQGLEGARRAKTLHIQNVYTVATAWYDKGALVAVNPDWWEAQFKADCDGDGMEVTPCGDYPETAKAILACHDMAVDQPKVNKKTPTGEIRLSKGEAAQSARTKALWWTMLSPVGQATNLWRATFLVADRERLAHAVGYQSARAMDTEMGWFIKIGTDVAKAPTDVTEILKKMNKIRAALAADNALGGYPMFYSKDRESYKDFVPELGDPNAHEEWTKQQKRFAVQPRWENVTARIARRFIPRAAEKLEVIIDRELPMFYRNWVNEPERKDLVDEALDLQNWWFRNSSRFEWHDRERFLARKKECVARFMRIVREGKTSVETFSEVVWWVAHNTERKGHGAYLAFMAIPWEQIERICTERPGINDPTKKSILVGVNRQLPDVAEKTSFEVRDVEVRMFRETGGDYPGLRRYAICGAYKGGQQRQSANPAHPKDTIGIVPPNATLCEGRARRMVATKGKGHGPGSFNVRLEGFVAEELTE